MFTPVTRRRFIEITPVIGMAGMAALAACSPKEDASSAKPAPAAASPGPAPAPAPTVAPATASSFPMLDEKDPQAIALGYVADASRTDQVKFNNYAPGNQCSNCGNFLGAVEDVAAGCKIFPNKRVAGKGWCTAWVKRA